MIKTSDFPYPVLRNDKRINTSYKRDFHFSINCEEPQNNSNEFVFNVKLDTNSNTLNGFLKNEKASLYLSYQTNIIKKTYKIDNNEFEYDIRIPYAYFQSLDEVKITSIITADHDFLLEYNDEIDEGYDLGVPYYITKKDILAISNDIIFDFNKTGKTIIKLIKSNDLVNSFIIDISQDDFILIKVNADFKKAYDIIAVKQSELKIPALTLINSSLIHMAMISVFMEIINGGYEQHSNKRWFKIIQYTLNSKEVIFEDVLMELQEELDIKEVYKYVDIFLNHFYEKAIIKCSEVLK